MADRYAVAPLLIPMALSMHVTLAAASGAASLYYLAYGLLPAAYGILADRYGRVRTMRGALAGMAVADVLSAVSPNLPFLLAARAITGGFACGVMPLTLVYVGDRFAFSVRQQAITTVLTFVALGTAAGTLVAGLIAHFLSWRVFFLLPGIAAAILTLGIGSLPESLVSRSGNRALAEIAVVLRNRWAIFLLTLSLVNGAVQFGLVTFLAPALEAHGFSVAIAGTVVASYGLAVLFCSRLFRVVARRVPVPLIVAGGGTMLLAGYLAAAITQTLPTILFASVMAGASYAFMHSTFQTWATDVVPHARATATALFATAIFGGAAIATAVLAGLASSHQYSRLFLIAATLTVPVVLAGSVGRSRYRGSEVEGAVQRGSQIG